MGLSSSSLCLPSSPAYTGRIADAFLVDFVGTNLQEKSYYNSPVSLPRAGKYCDQRLMDEEGEQKERKR